MTPDPDRPDQNEPPPPPGAILIKVFASATDAEAAAALLDANGISCWLHADDCGGMLSVLDQAHGVRMLVSPADVDSAKALLSASAMARSIPPADNGSVTDAHSLPPPRKLRLSLPQILAGMVVGVLLCLLYQWTSQLGTKSYPADYNRDGHADERWTYRNGLLVEHARDRNADGQLDAWNYFDRSSRYARSTADENFDGEIDTTWNYTNGILVTCVADTDFNGTPDVTYYFKNEISTRGDWQPNGTNIIVMREILRHGRLTEELRDTNYDGVFDVSIQYDAFLNPIATNRPVLPR